MDFNFTQEQLDIKKAAKEFAEGEFPNVAAEVDLKEAYPFDLLRKAGKLGMIGILIPEEYGGLGLGMTEHCIIVEEFWRVDPGCGMCLGSSVTGSEIIILF